MKLIFYILFGILFLDKYANVYVSGNTDDDDDDDEEEGGNGGADADDEEEGNGDDDDDEEEEEEQQQQGEEEEEEEEAGGADSGVEDNTADVPIRTGPQETHDSDSAEGARPARKKSRYLGDSSSDEESESDAAS